MGQQQVDEVADLVLGFLVPGTQQRDGGDEQLVVGEPPLGVGGPDQGIQQAVGRFPAVLRQQIGCESHDFFDVLVEPVFGRRGRRPGALDQCFVSVAVGRGHPEQLIDDIECQRQGEALNQVRRRARRQHGGHHVVRHLCDAGPQLPHLADRERLRDRIPYPGVLWRVHVHQAQWNDLWGSSRLVVGDRGGSEEAGVT
jgi:hypothetical protein